MLHVILLLTTAVLSFLFVKGKDYQSMSNDERYTVVGLTFWLCTLNFRANLIWQSTIILALLLIILWIIHRKKYNYHFIHGVFYGYFALHLLSAIWADNQSLEFHSINQYFAFLLVPLLLGTIQLKYSQLKVILIAFFRFMLLSVLISLACWVWQSLTLDIDLSQWLIVHKRSFMSQSAYNLVYAWTDHRHPTYNAIGIISAMAIGFQYLQLGKKTGIHIVESSLYTIASLLLIIVTQSRIGLIMWGIVLWMYLIYLFAHTKRARIISIAASIALALFGAFSIKENIQSFFKDDVRTTSYRAEFHYLEQNWRNIGGVGVGNTPLMYSTPEHAKAEGFDRYTLIDLRQNQFIGDWIQTGLIGLIFICAMYALLAWYWMRNKSMLALTLHAAALCVMLIEMYLYYSKGNFYFLAFNCLFLACISSKNSVISKDNDTAQIAK